MALLRGIYVIVNQSPQMLAVADAALESGVRILQYRAKSCFDGAHLQALRERTHRAEALLIVNDDWRAALAFDCDGVHVGPDDDGFAAVTALRSALGERIIGLSCGTVSEALRANDEDIDYIGVGAVYATRSKDDAGAPIGIERLQEIADVSRVPVAAIGGIGIDRIDDIRASGVAMAAVISAVSAAADPHFAARTLVGAWR